jgi:hypothetical protein
MNDSISNQQQQRMAMNESYTSHPPSPHPHPANEHSFQEFSEKRRAANEKKAIAATFVNASERSAGLLKYLSKLEEYVNREADVGTKTLKDIARDYLPNAPSSSSSSSNAEALLDPELARASLKLKERSLMLHKSVISCVAELVDCFEIHKANYYQQLKQCRYVCIAGFVVNYMQFIAALLQIFWNP